MSSEMEELFFEASHKLGRAIAALPKEEKDAAGKLYDDVREFASQQEVKGVHLDKAAFFAAGLILHPQISNEELVQAAADLIEKDWLFVKANQARPEEH